MVIYGQNLVTIYFYFLDDANYRLQFVFVHIDNILLCFTLLSKFILVC